MRRKALMLFSLFLMTASVICAQELKGKITDKNSNLPLQGVTVNIKGSAVSVQTDSAGTFRIPSVSKFPLELTVSHVGYLGANLSVTSSDDIFIQLEAENSTLSDIVVVGYGTVRKRDLTGSVVSVKGNEVRKVAAGNAMESLQGKLPGVDIVRTSGSAGARSNVTVRGNRSILADNGPLYIVDGIQYNNYQDINPNDIQSMEVLKDASSTAIYGSRGANGVILITTKKGASGKPKIGFSMYYGQTEVAGYPKPMTGPEYADLRRQAFRTIGTWNSPADDPKVFPNPADLAAVQNGTSFYWPGESIGKGSQQDYNVNVAAGTDKTKVFFAYGFFREEGLLKNDYSNRHTVRLNIDQAIGEKINVGLSSQLTHYDQNIRADGILNQSNKVIPYYTPYNADGTLARFPGQGNQFNPLYNNEPGYYVNDFNTSRILSTAYFEYRFAKGFNFRSNLGITNGNTRNGYFTDANTIERSLSTGSLSRVSNTTATDLTWENILNWTHQFGDHNLGVTALTSFIESTEEGSSASGTGQLLRSQSYNALQNNPANLAISSRYVKSTLLSGAFRINYNYKGKYFLAVTGRADGSSVLSDQNKWQFFPSVAAAWRIADEEFMRDANFLSDLKLRASYGYAGNSAVRPYSTQSGLILVPYSWNDVQALAYALDPQTGNSDLKWELTGTLNFGLDFGFWNQRVSGSIDIYDSKTEDLLLQRSLPASSGVSKVVQNIGKTRNRGIEISLQTVNIRNKNFTWSSGISYTSNKEEIVDLVNGKDDVANNWFIGKPVRSFYDYDKVGIWQTADSAAAASVGRKPGEIRVRDVNGDKLITAAGDRVVLGSAVPKYILGFTNDFKIGAFDLNVYVFARQGQMFISEYAQKFEPNAIENGASVNYWTPENPTNDYPRPNANISRASLPFATTLQYKDGSFVKIRNITLGYTLPKSVADKIHVRNIRIYASARNYFTWAKVDDYDPEGAGSFERPLNKLLLGGLNIDF
jgi:TonB-linked SusC/RagA family outer membrane protein